jgi:hypothetical protein
LSTPQQPATTIAAVLDALNATKDGIAATKDELGGLRADIKADREASQERDEVNARHGRRNSKWIAFDIAVTIALAVLGYLSVHAVDSASQANSAQLALCQSGNDARAKQVGLWEYVIHISPPPKTAQARKGITDFEAYLHTLFRPRDCNKLGRK